MIKPLLQSDRVSTLSVKELNLTYFRNYQNAHLEIGEESIVITGANGSGKTNLLEAISLLTPGRGIRNGGLADFTYRKERGVDDPFSNTPWAVNAVIRAADGEVILGTGLQPEKENRLVKINGEGQRGVSCLANYFSICYLTPRMDSLFVEGSGSRRQYLDRLTTILMLDHAKHLAIYQHAKSERMKLLKSGRYDEEWLSVLEKRMAEKGVAIAAARREAVELLQTAINKDCSPFPKANLSVSGTAEACLKQMSAVQAEENLANLLKISRRDDFNTGRTNIGPHKSDFLVEHCDRGFLADQCSTGEQKSMLLSITIASVRAKTAWSGIVPVLLLDEVVAHLDDEKRHALMEAVEALSAQCWMTGTDLSFFAGFQGKAQFLKVANSTVLE